MNRTSIEWTHRPGTIGMTWNPVRARLKGASPKSRSGTFCTKVSPGCQHCYASVINRRFGTGLEFTVPNLLEHEFSLDQRILEEPIKFKKPCTIFVGDMFDLFHEAIPVEMIAEVLRVAHKTPRHTFQFLTKRAERMQRTVNYAQEHWGVEFDSHMWFGVSVEDQKRADERIPLILQTRTAVRFLSVEPMLEAVNLDSDSVKGAHALGCGDLNHRDASEGFCRGVDWVICGGESGPGARPFNLAWAESLLEECRTANVAYFLKQLGSFPVMPEDIWQLEFNPINRAPIWLDAKNNTKQTPPPGTVALALRDRKGGDQWEWPEQLRVREFPNVQDREAVTA